MRKEYEVEKTTGYSSRILKMGINKLAVPKSRLLLVTGSGRCGTTFLASVLRKTGLDIGHEITLRDGVVSHFFTAPDHDWYPWRPWFKSGKAHRGERRSDYEFKVVAHLIRDPRACIPSMSKIYSNIDFEFYHETYGISKLTRGNRLEVCAELWLASNVAARKQSSVTVRIEHIKSDWPKLMHKLGRDDELPSARAMNKGSGYRKSQPLSDLDVFGALGDKIKKEALRYGYTFDK